MKQTTISPGSTTLPSLYELITDFRCPFDTCCGCRKDCLKEEVCKQFEIKFLNPKYPENNPKYTTPKVR